MIVFRQIERKEIKRIDDENYFVFGAGKVEKERKKERKKGRKKKKERKKERK